MEMSDISTFESFIRDPDYVQDFINHREYEKVTPTKSFMFRNVWQRFCGNTTAHGIPNYGRAKGNVKKCFWAILVIAALITVLYNLVILSSDYLSYPSDNAIILNHATSLDFPAVTICNLNPLKKSAMEARRARSHHRQKRATGQCDSGWVSYNGHCYYISTVKVAWENARIWCENEGASLIKIEDHVENTHLDTIAVPNADIQYWLGLNEFSGTWKWLDGTSLTYANWDPNDNPNGQCARMTGQGDWRMKRCKDKKYFFCKKEPTYYTTTVDEYTTDALTSNPMSDDTVTVIPTTSSEETVQTVETTKRATRTTPSTDTIRRSTDVFQSSPETAISDSTDTLLTDMRSLTSTSSDITTDNSAVFVTSELTHGQSQTKTDTPITTISLKNGSGSTPDKTTQRFTSNGITDGSTAPESKVKTTIGTKTIHKTTHKPLLSTPQMSSANSTLSQYSTYMSSSYSYGTKCCCVCCSPSVANIGTECQVCTQDSVGQAASCALTKAAAMETDEVSIPSDNGQEVQATTRMENHENGRSQTQMVTAYYTSPNTQGTKSTTAMDVMLETTKSLSQINSTNSDDISDSKPSVSTPLNGTKYSTAVDEQAMASVHTSAMNDSETVIETISQMTEEEMLTIGYSLNDLVLDCQYSGKICDNRYFSHLINHVHGNCFVFNSGWPNTSTIGKSKRIGRRYGLHMVLNVNQNEYPLSGSDTVGMRVVIHSKDRMPFPEDEGVTVSPGRATSIAIRQVELKYLPDPHGDCMNTSISHEDINMFEEKYPVSYSTKTCEQTCYQRHVIQTCGCGDPSLPRTGKAVSNVSVPVCSTSNHTQESCRQEVASQILKGEVECSCPVPCHSVMHNLGVSVGQWPSKVLKQEILQNLAGKIGDSFDITDSKAYSQNLVKLEIFFEAFNYESVQQRPKYQSGGLLSNIGGMLGLWVGFSVFTIIELVEVLVDVAVAMIYSSRTDPVGK